MSTPAQFARKCITFGTTLDAEQRKALSDSCSRYKRALLSAYAARGWPEKLRSGRRAGGVRYVVTADHATIWAWGGARYMFEYGAKRHKIAKRRGRDPRLGDEQAGDFGPVVGPVDHPGFAGRPWFAAGFTAGTPLAKREFESGLSRALTRTFGA